MEKINKDLVEEFLKTYCENCKSYFVCGGEYWVCADFEKFIKSKNNLKK